MASYPPWDDRDSHLSSVLVIWGGVAIFLYTIVPLGMFKSFARFDQVSQG